MLTPRLRRARGLSLPVLLGQHTSGEAAGGHGALAPRAAGFHRCTLAGSRPRGDHMQTGQRRAISAAGRTRGQLMVSPPDLTLLMYRGPQGASTA